MRWSSHWVGVIALALSACGPGAAAPESPSAGDRRVTLLYVADLHSHLLPEAILVSRAEAAHGLGESDEPAVVGGAARLATVLDESRADAPSLLLDAGDLLEGTSFYPRFGGEPEMRVAEALGVDALSFGNHDLSQGAEVVAALRRKWASFPLLGANLDAEIAAGFALPFTRIDRGGVRVLVVGLARRPVGVPELVRCATQVNDVVASYRSEVDLVVLLSHLGRDADRALVPMTAGLDVVIGGHTHDVLDPPVLVSDCEPETAARFGCESRPVPVVHPGAYGRFVGRAELVLSSDPLDGIPAGGRPSAVIDTRFSVVPVTEHVTPRADVDALLEPYAAALDVAGDDAPVAFSPEVLRRRAVASGDSALGDVVADALREAAAADVAVINSTGIRADVLAGPVSAGDVTRVLPFSDDLVVVRLSLDELRAALRDAASPACASGDPSPFQVAGVTVAVTCRPLGVVVSRPVTAADGFLRVAAPSFLTEARYLEPPDPSRLESSAGPLRDAVLSVIRARAPCAGGEGGGLPCLMGTADGRVGFRR